MAAAGAAAAGAAAEGAVDAAYAHLAKTNFLDPVGDWNTQMEDPRVGPGGYTSIN